MPTVANQFVSVLNKPAGGLRKYWALLAIAGFSLLLTLGTYRYYGTFIRGADAQMYYAQVRSLVVDGDFQYRNEILELTPHSEVFYGSDGELRVPITDDGRLVNKYTAGWAVATLPVFVVIHFVEVQLGGSATGYTAAYDIGVALWHWLLVMIALTLIWRMLCNWFSHATASVAIAGGFLATNLMYYTCVYPTASHAIGFVAVTFVLLTAVKVFESTYAQTVNQHQSIQKIAVKPWVLASLAAAFVVLVRPTDAVLLFMFVPSLYRCWKCSKRSGLQSTCIMAAGVACGVLVQLSVWRASLGYWTLNPYGDQGESFYWFTPALPDILTSTHHGAWYFHPVFIVGFAGLMWMAVKGSNRTGASRGLKSKNEDQGRMVNGKRSLFAAMFVAYLLHIYVHASWHEWTFGYSFGHRLFVNSAPLMCVGLAAVVDRFAIERSRLRLSLASIVLAVLVSWNLLLMLSYIEGRVPSTGHVSPSMLIEAQIDTLRRASL